MNRSVLIIVFTRLLIGIAIASGFIVLVAVGYGEYQVIKGFSVFGLFSFFIGIFGYVFSVKTVKVKASDLLVIIFLCYFLIPIFMTLPLLNSNLSLNFIQAYFETVSALTTTGATRLDVLILPKSIILWLVLLQFFGGIITLTLFIIVFSIFNTIGPRLHKTVLFVYDTENIGNYFVETLIVISRFFLIISALLFLVLWISDIGAFNAFSLALAIPVTSGFSPYEGMLDHFILLPAQLIIALVLILGALNSVKQIDFFQRLNHKIPREFDLETKSFFILILLLTFLGILYTDSFEFKTIFHNLIEAISLMSTSAYDFSKSGIDQIPKTFKLAFVLIGGSVLSTAGGIKVIRFILLLRYSFSEVSKVSQPLSIGTLKYKNLPITEYQYIGIWIYFMAFTMMIALCILCLTFLNIDFNQSVTLAISTISNAGPLYEQLGIYYSYTRLSDSVLILLSITMIFGKLEVLTILAAFIPSLWKK